MLKTIFILMLSFFAVIGFIECILSFLEAISLSKYNQVRSVTLLAELGGRIDNVPFLLNTLMLQAERIRYKNVISDVIIRDGGLDEHTYSEICAFCLENDNIDVEK